MNSLPDVDRSNFNNRHIVKSSAFLSTLYLTHADGLRRFATARGATREDAEEMVQEVFIRLNTQERLANVQNALAYMRTIVINLLKDQYRQNARQPDMLDIDNIDEPADAPATNPAVNYDHCEAIQHMQDDLMTLPEQTRQVFLQHRVHGKSYDAIAGELCLTVATVRKHLSQCLVLLTQKRIERDS